MLIPKSVKIQDEANEYNDKNECKREFKRDSLEKIDAIRHKYDHKGHFLILFEW